MFLPFAFACYLTYLFRTINALISSRLMSDLSLGAADLGLLTAVYFLVLAASQIPTGVLLDRCGPRRAQSGLLLVAAAGAALFGMAQTLMPLLIARAMLGLGVAAAMTAGFKAIVLWFPKERVASVNAYMTMLGALGAVTATLPAEYLIDWIGWRGLFELLALTTVISAALIFVVVPEQLASAPKRSTPTSLKDVCTDLRFWRLAPLSATCIGSAWALGGLWAAPWLTDVEDSNRATLIVELFIMALTASLGALLLGALNQRLRRHGIGAHTLFSALAVLFIAAQLALIFRAPLPAVLPWSLVAIVGAGTVLSYVIVAEHFPSEMAGRANGLLNVFHFGWAFVVQYAVGLILDQWPRLNGHYPATAYQIAFSLNVLLQVLALAWFELPRLRTLVLQANSRFLGSSVHYSASLTSDTRYQKAMRIWTERLMATRMQTRSWRFAALGSAGLCVALGLALAVSSSRAEVTPYIIKIDHLSKAVAISPPIAPPSDAQIAYFLKRFVTNVRSLSTDPIVVRSNWTDALSYVTARGAQMLSDYARDAKPFMRLGRQTVTTEVTSVVRASQTSFEVHWQEETFENGAIVESDGYTGIADIGFGPPSRTDTLRNPLGLLVNAFSWARDTN